MREASRGWHLLLIARRGAGAGGGDACVVGDTVGDRERFVAQRALDAAETKIATNEIDLQPLTEMYQKQVQENEEAFVK